VLAVIGLNIAKALTVAIVTAKANAKIIVMILVFNFINNKKPFKLYDLFYHFMTRQVNSKKRFFGKRNFNSDMHKTASPYLINMHIKSASFISRFFPLVKFRIMW
jgi:hypothetical protein